MPSPHLFLSQAMLNKAHIKLNAKKLYAADGHAVKVRTCVQLVRGFCFSGDGQLKYNAMLFASACTT